MKQKQILEFVQSIVTSLQGKEESERETNLPDEIKEYTKGQLYEAQYILTNIEEIIFRD
jgi:hypothetical protein